MEQRVLVCGGRNYVDRKRVYEVLDLAHRANPSVLLIHGDAPGADTRADDWAYDRRVRVKKYSADWDTFGNAAGPMRNPRMLDDGKPHVVIAFPGGKGTTDMREQAERANVPVVVVTPRYARRIA